MFTVQGFSFAGTGQNTGIAFVNLKDWIGTQAPGPRRRRGRSPVRWSRCLQIKDAFAFAFAAAADARARHRTGFAFFLKDSAGLRPRGADCGPQPVPRRGQRRASCWPTSARTARKTLRSCASTSTTRRRRRWACRSPTSTRRSPRPGAASTSTTSSIAAVSSACIVQCRCAVPHDARGLQAAGRCAMTTGRDGAVPGIRHARTGTTARRGSSATTASRRWKSTARPRRA